MCGIFAVVKKERCAHLGSMLRQAGMRLVYRGYDSVGVGVVDGGKVDLRKDVGTVEEVAEKLKFDEMGGERGIVQLRWATFGRPSKENAQPHVDCKRQLLGAHNGNVVNTRELKSYLEKKGHKFAGDNDGELLVHLVEEHYSGDLLEAVVEADKEVVGDYAFAVTSVDAHEFVAVKKGSSLFLGKGEDFICVSSDIIAVLQFTDMVLPLRDGEVVWFDWKDYKIYEMETMREVTRPVEKSVLSVESADKGEFPHYMIKEISESFDKLRSLFKYLEYSREADQFCEEVSRAKRVFVLGSGTSYHAAIAGAEMLSRFGGAKSFSMTPGIFRRNYLSHMTDEDLVVGVSQSGETKDVINALNDVERVGLKHRFWGIVNVIGSTIALRTKYLPIVSDLEISVPATKTFTNQFFLFAYLSHKLGGINYDFFSLEEKGREFFSEKAEEIKRLASSFEGVRSTFCLGYSLSYPIALECSLKIKEVCYVHAEGMESAEFKHGPLALVENGFPILFFANSEDESVIASGLSEVEVRGGKNVLFSPPSSIFSKHASYHVVYPEDDLLASSLYHIISLQLFAYYLSVHLGINPDRPRNLSKTLTVD